MGIFQKSVMKNHLTQLDKEQVDNSFDKFKENYSAAKISEVNNLQSQINQTSEEIDQMNYQLYELTEEEIKIVEESV